MHRLRWLDVDQLHRQINLPQTKNGQSRVIFLNEGALDVFCSLAFDTDTEANEPVFGLDVTLEEVSMTFMRACRKAGISDFRFHDLRHTRDLAQAEASSIGRNRSSAWPLGPAHDDTICSP